MCNLLCTYMLFNFLVMFCSTVAHLASSFWRPRWWCWSLHHQLSLLYIMGFDIRCTFSVARKNVRALCMWLWWDITITSFKKSTVIIDTSRFKLILCQKNVFICFCIAILKFVININFIFYKKVYIGGQTEEKWFLTVLLHIILFINII